MFLALVINSKRFSTLFVTFSSPNIVMTNVLSPRSTAHPSHLGLPRWTLMKSTHIFMTTSIPMSSGLANGVPKGMFIFQSLSKQTTFTPVCLSILITYRVESFGEARFLKYLLVHEN